MESASMESASRRPLRQEQPSWMRGSLLGLLMALLITPAALMPHTSRAATPPAAEQKPASATADEEELFDEQLREFGYWSGAAFGCVAKAQEAEAERRILETYHRIARLFGTDRAFFYAAAFGRGTAIEIEKERCPEFLRKFEESTLLRGQPRPGQ